MQLLKLFLNAILVVIILLTSCNGDKQKPNVVLVITDDQGYGDIAAHGNPWIKTPSMDKLWEESVRLTDYHVSPTCAPTRSALMTGRYNDRVGVWHTVTGRTLLRENEVTMAQVFEDNGYATGMFGKWHLGDNYPRRPIDVGFQKAIYIGGGAIGNAADYWDNDYFDDHYFDNGEFRQFEGYCTDVWFREATKFIDNNKDKPFFCYLATNAPHGPYNVEDKYSNQYKDNPLIPNDNFYGMITNIDENLGKLRAYLKEENLDDNTIFIFMTDNGSAAGIRLQRQESDRIPNDGIPTVRGFNAGMRGRKGSAFEGGHRVPFFIHWPAGGLDEGRDFEGLSAHIDIFPSLIEMCGLEKNEGPEFDGISLWQYLKGKLKWKKGKRTLFVDSQRIEVPIYFRRSAAMQKKWRLLYGEELYNMEIDPGQRHDVALRYPEKLEELRSLYDSWYNDVFSGYETRSYIHIGSEKVPSMKLTSHDWMGVFVEGSKSPPPGVQVPTSHSHGRIRRGYQANGYWDIEVERSGKYKIELMRWPKEAGKGITEGIPASTIQIPGGRPFPKGVALNIRNARLQIQDFDSTVAVTDNMKAAEFTVDLEPGKTRLKTFFTGDEGLSLGAYYVYISLTE